MKYYLLLVQASSGIVLNHDGKTFFIQNSENDQLPYIEVDSFDEAEKQAKVLARTDLNLEIVICNSSKEFIQTFCSKGQPPPIKIKNMKTKAKLVAALKIWVVIYPSITLFLSLFGEALSFLPLYQRTFILTASLVPWIMFVGVPIVDFFIRQFLVKRPTN